MFDGADAGAGDRWLSRARQFFILLLFMGRASADVPAELLVQLSHSKPVSAVSIAADAPLLATSSWDGTVRLWDLPSARQLRVIQIANGIPQSVALSADGQQFIAGTDQGVVERFDSADGSRALAYKGHTAAVRAVALSVNDRLLAAGSDDETVRVWNFQSGEEIRRLRGFEGGVVALHFTADGRSLVVASPLRIARFALENWQQVQSFSDHAAGISALAVAPDSRFALTGDLSGEVALWSLANGAELRRVQLPANSIASLAIAPDGASFAVGTSDGRVQLWPYAGGSGQETHRFEREFPVTALRFAPDGRSLLATSRNTTHRWSIDDGLLLRRYRGNTETQSSIAFAPDGKSLLIGGWDDAAMIWNLESGVVEQRLLAHTDDVRAVAYSVDGAIVATGGRDVARLWQATTGLPIVELGNHAGGVRPVDFSADGRYLLTGGDDKSIAVRSAVAPFSLLRTLAPHPGRVSWAVFSPDSAFIAAASATEIALWDVETGAVRQTLKGHSRLLNSVAFNPAGTRLVSASWDGVARVWNSSSGQPLLALRHGTAGVLSARFSPDGEQIVTADSLGVLHLWRAADGEELRRFVGHRDSVLIAEFSPDGRFLVSVSTDQTTRLWDVATGRALCRLVTFQDGSWAVVDSDGRFDASNGGEIDGLHWVIGTETIGLDQLKERYYDPGLLAKKLGRHSEPVRDVAAFTEPKLFPRVQLEPLVPTSTHLNVQLTNRGGGIGQVAVFVNGRQVIEDARPEPFDSTARALTLAIPIADHPYLIAGRNNDVSVRAFNAENYLASRAIGVDFVPRGPVLAQQVTLWAVIGGVADYAGDALDLRFAGKDALDFERGLRLAAKRLFGADKVQTRLLTTESAPAALSPIKANFQSAFAELEQAKPWDIVVVYLAGHGLVVADDYHYLTRDARSTDFTDPQVRAAATFSSAELGAWIARSPALKQVLILDTCASGQAANRLVESREVSSEQIRSLERLQDRTGFHMLMGSAADAVSYEASQYQQGLLTYALLQGMRGPGLRDEQFVDVGRLFQYAADEVPVLARSVGGVQKPRIAAPRATSFDIGQLTPTDLQQIPLKTAKPMLVHPVLLNEQELFDDLNLSPLLRAHLRNLSFAATADRSVELPFVYVNAAELAGAVRASGTYQLVGEQVSVSLVLSLDGSRLTTAEVSGLRSDLPALAATIAETVGTALRAAALPAP